MQRIFPLLMIGLTLAEVGSDKSQATTHHDVAKLARGSSHDQILATLKAQLSAMETRLGKQHPNDEPKTADGEFPQKEGPAQNRGFKPGDEFEDCGVCPKMVVVPSGNFMMGSPKGERDREDVEGPQRRVTIKRPFAVGKFEVTFAEWRACVSDKGCSYKPYDHGWGRGQRPVIYVSWHDTKSYVSWLSRKTGKAYRLLSEAEWEYAARAGTTTRFHFGDSEKDLCAYANGADRSTSLNWKNMSCNDGVGEKTAQVGRFKSNAFGLHDMHGNVWEWVDDCWNETYAGAPSDGSSRTSGDCSRRGIRGGSWHFSPGRLRSAFRFDGTADLRDYELGFRVARPLTP